MYRTEANAKTLWCPFTRLALASDMSRPSGRSANISYPGGAPAGHNRVQVSNVDEVIIPDSTLCIASRCMAWRWEIPENAVATGRGYCGLAGKP